MKQQSMFPPEPIRAAYPGEPDLWVKRLVILRSRTAAPEPIRDIEFRLGLNVIRVEDARSGTGKAVGHDVGKTLLVRLIRYGLGDTYFADQNARERVREVVPDAWVAAVVRVKGKTWSVARSLGKRNEGWCKESENWKTLLGDTAGLRPYSAFLEALGELVPDEFAKVHLDGPGRPPAWGDLLGWLARDQRCRYTHHAQWRHADAESGVAALSLTDANLVTRLAVGLFDPDENRLGERLDELRADSQHCQDEIAREGVASDSIRAGLLQRLEYQGDVPDGPLFIVSLREHIREKREGIERRLRGDEQRRDRDEAERRWVEASRSVERTAGRLEELERQVKVKTGQLDAATRPATGKALAQLRTAMSCGLDGCHHLKPGSGPVADPLREERQRGLKAELDGLQREIESARATLRDQEKSATSAEEGRDKARDRYESRTAGLRQSIAGFDSAEDELTRYSASQDRLANYEARLRTNAERERDLEKQRDARGGNRGQALALLNEVFAEVTEALVCRPSGALILNLRDGLAPKADAAAGEAYGTAGRVIGFDLTCLLAAMFGRKGHPRFLIHDSPREADMHASIYENLFRFVRGLEDRFAGQPPAFQYIITTTTPPPDEVAAPPYVREALDATTAEGLLLRARF